MADLAARLAAQRLDLARRERREVVVHVERLLPVAEQRVELLLVVLGAERDGDQRLGLAAGEQRRAVRARQHAGLDRDRADLVGAAAVDALARRQRVDRAPTSSGACANAASTSLALPAHGWPSAVSAARVSRCTRATARRGAPSCPWSASRRASRSHASSLTRAASASSVTGGVNGRFSLPFAARSRSCSSISGWTAWCANSSASITTSSCSSCISPSTIMIASLLAATMMSMSRLLALGERRVRDELAVDRGRRGRRRAGRPTRGRRGGARPTRRSSRARRSAFSLSNETTFAMICVSMNQPFGNSGRTGRSIRRQIRISVVGGATLAAEEAARDLARRVELLAGTRRSAA